MSGRAGLKRAAAMLLAVGAIGLMAGCAGADHSWRGEFDARLEGATAAIEADLGKFQPDSPQDELFRTTFELASPLEFKGNLIQELHPPADCEAVEEKGWRGVDEMATLSADVFKDLTPELQRSLPRLYEEAIAEYKELEHEAETCA
jgi:hypothetical protein